jgi:polyisoprenoid-binding protein YceI
MMTNWNIDLGHSQVNFSARHMMLTTTRGLFTQFGGIVQFDPTNLTDSIVEITIDTSSISTGEAKRDEHMKLEDFFEVKQFPTMNFKSRKVEAINSQKAKMTGDLTIKGITKEVVLEVTNFGQQTSQTGQVHAGFNAITTINRDDWGLTWNVALDAGGWLISKEVKIEIDLELIAQDPK